MSTQVKTEVNTVVELVSTEALAFIRASTIKITASLLKPNTRMYAFFDGVSIDQYITPEGGVIGDPIITDQFGSVTAYFDIPESAFTVGDKELVFTDVPVYNEDVVQMKASAIYTAEGTLETYQATETTIITTTKTKTVVNYDPLAQSFFTYGIEGGCFISSIDLFFLTKDDTHPAWIELREMVNGYPGPKLVDPAAIKILNPDQIHTSSDGSVPTNFKFDKLIYLEQDKDYCFVVRSNVDRYNIFTSKLGEMSIETGAPVLDQPYMGSLFKSENNITWTAEQYEDIKFTMYRADFDTSQTTTVDVALHPGVLAVESTEFSTVSGTDRVTLKLPVSHGLTPNSLIGIGADEDATYNGIPGNLLHGEHEVSRVISDKEVEFRVVGASATSTGPITTGGRILDISIDAQGSGYTTPPQVVIHRNGGSGVDATARAVITEGRVTAVIITNPGTGYFNPPTIEFVSPTGSGAAAQAITQPLLGVSINRIYHSLKAMVDHRVPLGAGLSAGLTTTLGNYDGGPNVQYLSGGFYDIDITNVNKLDNNMLATSRANEEEIMGSKPGTKLSFLMSSTNSNVSPVIDLTKSAFQLKANYVNNQVSENVYSPNVSGSLLPGSSGITIINPGVGYLSAPEIVIHGTGEGAAATCTISDGAIDSVTVTDVGSGYIGPVTVEFVGGDPLVPATAVANVTDYNSELGGEVEGNAFSRYISTRQSTANVSTGFKIFATAFSNSSSSFEIYVKTSLSSNEENHDQNNWILLECDTPRNLSKSPDDLYDYEFYAYDLPEFDRYSIKIVLRTTTPWSPPEIINYRTIVVS